MMFGLLRAYWVVTALAASGLVLPTLPATQKLPIVRSLPDIPMQVGIDVQGIADDLRGAVLPKAGEEGRIVRVVDGDTAVVNVAGVNERVRFLLVDTPETVKPNAKVECYGRAASAATKRRLPEGTKVRLTYDVEKRDKHGRLLAYVERGELDVGEWLLANGYARYLQIDPNRARSRKYERAEDAARARDRGLWASCS